jgi:hypothetical protein
VLQDFLELAVTAVTVVASPRSMQRSRYPWEEDPSSTLENSR